MKAMETLQDLIEEAKFRTAWWALCIFAISYFLSHTSKSMWTNIPMSILLVSALRILSYKVEFCWRVRLVRGPTYLSHLEKKQLSGDDPRLSTVPTPSKWKRKIDSPLVEAAVDEFIKKILQEFVIDLWYSAISPDMEAPELIRELITDVLGEISGRAKEINLVDLLTRDMVDLIGDHLDLYRRNQSAIGVDVMGTLSSEERDERLKHYLMASKELHPALISPECEYKVLQRLMGGVLAVVLRPREAQCPLVRCISRELLTCLVMQPIMNFASPGYINELIEYIFLTAKDDRDREVGDDRHDHSVVVGVVQSGEPTSRRNVPTSNQRSDTTLAKVTKQRETYVNSSGNSHLHTFHGDSVQSQLADWARVLEAATQRRTEVLAPENLENLWTKGRNYKITVEKHVKAGLPPIMKTSGVYGTVPGRNSGKEMLVSRPGIFTGTEDKAMVRVTHELSANTQRSDGNDIETPLSQDLSKEPSFLGGNPVDKLESNTILAAKGNKAELKRSSSTSALKSQSDDEKTSTSEGGGAIVSEFYSPNIGRHKEDYCVRSASDMVFHSEGLPNVIKLKCRVIGAYFEKIGSKSFAVYSIVVTDAENKTWFVKRRYRNFERLHRHLKDIPNYTLHLPPKRIFSSSTEDAFVHQRCILLDKYLQDLLSIANVAEQHEVWDFLSATSKIYASGKSSSVMRTLAVNVDDAVDDIVRQFKGVSDGLMRKVVGSSSSAYEASPLFPGRHLSWNGDEINNLGSSQYSIETSNSFSDNEDGKDGSPGREEIGSSAQVNGWHSDNELNSKDFPPRVVKRVENSRGLDSKRNPNLEVKPERIGAGGYPAASSLVTSDLLEDPVGMPPEWTPPNVSMPLLSLVDKIFQLKRRGWLRRQVFWISKQILQLMMEDAIDDWILRQIHWLRRDDNIAEGIHWVQDVLWPNGTFFLKLENSQGEIDDTQFYLKPEHIADHLAGNKVPKPGSFELQLEASRRAKDVKKMILGGAPTALVSLIGHKQYRRCAKDIYYFLQSTICVKQLAYGMLELLLVSVFPELRDLILDVHEKMGVQPA
ncbi:hypothetical protein HHK36_003123 [Tetracentron sinense]|uniref:Uncharacterized protein n=1 Tax=Tetracentron sinense TaxID=13715 RepID=A0A834ZNR3_TETSI|nr:hypothetical protein HHK36_003123 [Tetracentron sinense]